MDDLALAHDLLAAATDVVVLTGAGISTDSGIADFRGPQGLWTMNPKAEKLSNIRSYVEDPEVRRLAWQGRLESPVWQAEPNPGHHALVRLEARGRLHLLVTQNVDGLHLKAGTSREKLVEVHGTMRDVACLSCDFREPIGSTLDRVRNGEADPDCPACGGILKSATISFGQSLVPDDIDRALRSAAEADLLLAVGSTLGVYPVADMVPIAHSAGADVVIVNADPTPYDPIAAAVVRGSISEVLPAIVGE